MFRGSARSILSLALLLPGGNLSLLTSKGSLVVLVVVDLRVVVLYALKEQVASLLEERINGKIKRVVVREEGWLGDVGVLLQGSQVGWELELLLWCTRRQLVQERGEEMRVVNSDGKLDQDVVVAETTLLQTVDVRLTRKLGIVPVYLSVVNLPSLYAVTKEDDSLYARRFRVP